MSKVPTIDELRKFIKHQITEYRMLGNEKSVNELLDKLHNIEETYKFIQQTIGERAAAAWVPTVPTEREEQ